MASLLVSYPASNSLIILKVFHFGKVWKRYGVALNHNAPSSALPECLKHPARKFQLERPRRCVLVQAGSPMLMPWRDVEVRLLAALLRMGFSPGSNRFHWKVRTQNSQRQKMKILRPLYMVHLAGKEKCELLEQLHDARRVISGCGSSGDDRDLRPGAAIAATA